MNILLALLIGVVGVIRNYIGVLWCASCILYARWLLVLSSISIRHGENNWTLNFI